MTSPAARQPAGADGQRHYSYAVYADPETAARFDERRFGGPIGALIAESQERVVAGFLGDVAGRRILDVGAGTGRAAIALARRGARVIGVDASAEMLNIARERAAGERLEIEFTVDDAHALSFGDRSFETAVCLRLLMHAPDWTRCVAELCRVSDRRVVFDYPALCSMAAVQALSRRAAAAAGRRVEAYRVISTCAVRRELASHGFRLVAVHRQFVLPIAFHKLMGSRGFTLAIERALAAVGLLWLAGSPVTILAER